MNDLVNKSAQCGVRIRADAIVPQLTTSHPLQSRWMLVIPPLRLIQPDARLDEERCERGREKTGAL